MPRGSWAGRRAHQTLGRWVARLQDALALSWSSATQDRRASVHARLPEEAGDGGQG